MLRYARTVRFSQVGNSVRTSSGSFGPIRTIFISSHDRKSPSHSLSPISNLPNHNDSSTERARKTLDDDFQRKIKYDELKTRKRIEDLRALTKKVSQLVKQKQELSKIAKIPVPSDEIKKLKNVEDVVKVTKSQHVATVRTNIPEPETVTTHIEKEESEFVMEQNAFIVPATPIPEEIAKRLGLALRYLVSETNQNWTLVLDQLKADRGFKDLPYTTVVDFLTKIPASELQKVIPKVDQLLKEAKIPKTAKILNLYIASLASGSAVPNQVIQILENYCKRIRKLKKGKLPKRTCEVMVQAYGKNGNINRIQDLLSEMKLHKIEISGMALTNILATCVYKARDHKQAVEIFDTMRFQKEVYKPGTRAYQDIIVSYVNNDDIEKAIDIYREMITEKIEPNQQIMVALARGCASREAFKFKSWDFIFEINRNNWTPTLPTYEYMLYLSSRDGDLALTRALYSRLLKDNTVSLRSFNFLLLAYSKARLSDDLGEPFLINADEKGRKFRFNVIDRSGISDPTNQFPFLPFNELTTKEQIMAESSAIWAHACLNNSELINSESTTSYLNIASERGTLSDFIDRMEGSTFLDEKINNVLSGVVIEEPDVVVETTDFLTQKSSAHEKYDETSIVKSPILKSIQSKRTPRVSLTYVVALKAAGKFNNYNFANRIWQERGKFRKTETFKKLPRTEKDKLDFQFATQMVRTLTELNLLEDALAVLKSTEYQFRWTWKELDVLKSAAIRQGNTNVAQTVRSIARRAQLTYEGKIRRKDYKRYVMQRGY
ncbi:hypothetical protein G9P44_003077 [Scheffersomyces stipitis]|nr:hypothetical protein G9P44_003077 [Scheffersomyces stipitis]